MDHAALAVLFVVLLWWGATGVIFYLDGLPRRTHRWSLTGATVAGLAGLWGLGATAGDASAGGIYTAFICAIAVWGWHEMSFLTGLVAGPRRRPCPPGCRGAAHFRHGVEAILYHELAIAATGLVVLALTWGGANQVGLWVFLALWGMRLSAKLNLHLGVPNTAAELLPDHLAYLGTFFSRGPINPLFPVSVTIGTIATALLATAAMNVPVGDPAGLGFTMLSALLALGVFEHWFLVLPMPAGNLWRWALGPRAQPQNDPGPMAESHAVVREETDTTPSGAELRARVVSFPRGG